MAHRDPPKRLVQVHLLQPFAPTSHDRQMVGVAIDEGCQRLDVGPDRHVHGEAWVVGYGIDADRIIALTHQSPDETRRAIGLRIHMVERVHEACIVGMVFRLHKPGDVDLCDVKTSHS